MADEEGDGNERKARKRNRSDTRLKKQKERGTKREEEVKIEAQVWMKNMKKTG